MEHLVESLKYFFISLNNPILQALVGGLFTWGLTALGASLVFFFKSTNRKTLDMALGFTGGVMIAASFWSLLSPAIASVEVQQKLDSYGNKSRMIDSNPGFNTISLSLGKFSNCPPQGGLTFTAYLVIIYMYSELAVKL